MLTRPAMIVLSLALMMATAASARRHRRTPRPSGVLSRAQTGRLINTNAAIRGAVRQIRQAHSILTEAQLQKTQSNLDQRKVGGTPLGYFYKQRRVMEKGPRVCNFAPLKKHGRVVGYRAEVHTSAFTPVGSMGSYSTVRIGLNGAIEGTAFSDGWGSPFTSEAIKAAQPTLKARGLTGLARSPR
jgi:hypothetical protein